MSSSPEPTAAADPTPGPPLTIAICTYNRAALLQKTVAALLPQLAGDTELLVVDNASIDGTAAVLAGQSRVRACREEKIGLSVARNTALAAARGEYVIFVDDDVVVNPGWLESYRRFCGSRRGRRGRRGGTGF